MIAAVDFFFGNSLVINLDALFGFINSSLSAFNEFASKVSWRPWFYLIGTAGFSMTYFAIKQKNPYLAVWYLFGTSAICLISFLMLNHADPGRVHRYTVNAMVVTTLLVTLFGSVVIRGSFDWKKLSDPEKTDLVVTAGVALFGLIVVQIIYFAAYQTRVAEMSDVSAQVEQKYGAELRAMKFEVFYNNTNLYCDVCKTIVINGETLRAKEGFYIHDPDDNRKYLFDGELSFEIGMSDNKPIIMIGKIDRDNYPRDKVVRAVNDTVERAIKQIREASQQVEKHKANRKEWAEVVSRTRNPSTISQPI